MNVPLPRIHPSTLGEAFVRLEACALDHMARCGQNYLQISYDNGQVETSIEDFASDARRGLFSIRDLAMMTAPGFGHQWCPTALEFFLDGAVLHLGEFSFGVSHTPCVMLANDYDVALQVARRVVSPGYTSPHSISFMNQTAVIEAVDQVDAYMRVALLSGRMSSTSNSGVFHLDPHSHEASNLSSDMIAMINARLARAMAEFGQAAE